MRIRARPNSAGAHAKAAGAPATVGVIAVGAAAAILAAAGITLASTSSGETQSRGQGATRATTIPEISPGVASTTTGKGAEAGVVPGVDGNSGRGLYLGASNQFKTTVTTSGVPSPGTYYVTASVSVKNPAIADQVLCAVRSGTSPFGGSVQAGQSLTVSGTDKVTLAVGQPITLLCESMHATTAHQTQITGMVTAIKAG
jgi:hypothetical protein